MENNEEIVRENAAETGEESFDETDFFDDTVVDDETEISAGNITEELDKPAVTAAAAAAKAAPKPAAASMEQSLPPQPKKKKKKRKWVIGLVVVLCILAALCGGYAFLCYKGDTTSIDTQYFVNGVNITGMNEETATRAIQKDFEAEYADSEYIVEVGEDSFTIPVAPFLSIDASKEIGRALSYDPGPWLGRGLKYIRSKVALVDEEEYTVTPTLEDKEGLLKASQKVGESVFEDPEDASWTENDGVISITKGESGKSVDVQKICDEIAEGIEEGNYSGSVNAPVILSEPKEIDAQKIAKAMFVAPKDASYDLVDNELVVHPSEEGREISAAEIKEAFEKAAEGTTVTVASNPVEPTVSADDLNAVLLADKLSGYAVVDGGSWSQINNQSIACEAINGTIIMPGEIFSFNEVVGDTTEEKGYVEDYAYENNTLVRQFGGGVCRVASTLYAAVLYTDLEIVERYNHTSPVHYLPYGMDATVSYPEPDLQFLNNREYPIMIEMFLGDDGYVHSGIYGTKAEDDLYVDVELDFINDMLVDTYRNYYDEEDGELLYQEYMHTSSYRELTPAETAAPAVVTTPEPTETQTPEGTPAPDAAPAADATPAPEPEAPAEEAAPADEGGEASAAEEGAGA